MYILNVTIFMLVTSTLIVINEVTDVYDGDTFRVNINSWPKVIGLDIPVRIKGIDTPEIRGKCDKTKGLEAKEFTSGILESAKVIELSNIERGKYFRLLADVYVDGESLARLLIEANHARVYDGKTRGNWCK